jgi:hypothetical protein
MCLFLLLFHWKCHRHSAFPTGGVSTVNCAFKDHLVGDRLVGDRLVGDMAEMSREILHDSRKCAMKLLNTLFAPSVLVDSHLKPHTSGL